MQLDSPVAGYAQVDPPRPPQGHIVIENAVQRWIVKLRWAIFALAALIIIAGYNGQWRVGRDSSLYRAVAQNLASGKGYTFRGQRERHIYPGLPYLLAGIDKVFGPQDPLAPRAALIVMMVLGLLTLVVIYHLVRTYFPPWIAVAVTFGVAINTQFLQQSHELMTDLPFLLGACMTMLGIARISTQKTLPRRVAFALLIVAGAVLAVTMRPTFWALLFAWLGACFIGMLRSRRRVAWGIGLATAVGILVLWVVLDPRSPGRSLTGGRYEQKVISTLQHLKDVKWADNFAKLTSSHLPEFFFGFDIPMPWGPIVCGILLVASILLVRRSPLWGLYVAVTVMMIIVLGGTARYYLMILPLLLVGWATFAEWISSLTTHWWRDIPYAGELVMLFWLSFATVPHLVRDGALVLEQHGYTRQWEHKGFLEVYRDGFGRDLAAISNEVSRRVPQGEVVLGVEPRITTYLSGRHVYTPKEVLEGVRQSAWPKVLRKRKPTWLFYDTKDNSKMIRRLIVSRSVIIAPGNETKIEGMVLAPIEIGEKITTKTKKSSGKFKKRQAATRPVMEERPRNRPPATRPSRKRGGRSPVTAPAMPTAR